MTPNPIRSALLILMHDGRAIQFYSKALVIVVRLTSKLLKNHRREFRRNPLDRIDQTVDAISANKTEMKFIRLRFCEQGKHSHLSRVRVAIRPRRNRNSNRCDRCRTRVRRCTGKKEGTNDAINGTVHKVNENQIDGEDDFTGVSVWPVPIDANEPAIVEMCSASPNVVSC